MSTKEPNTQGDSWKEEAKRFFLERAKTVSDIDEVAFIAIRYTDFEEYISKERAEGERRGAERTTDYIRKNIVAIDKRSVTDQVFELDLFELDALLEKATLPADSTEA